MRMYIQSERSYYVPLRLCFEERLRVSFCIGDATATKVQIVIYKWFKTNNKAWANKYVYKDRYYMNIYVVDDCDNEHILLSNDYLLDGENKVSVVSPATFENLRYKFFLRYNSLDLVGTSISAFRRNSDAFEQWVNECEANDLFSLIEIIGNMLDAISAKDINIGYGV